MSSDEEVNDMSDDEDGVRAASDGEDNLSPAEDAGNLVEQLEHIEPVEQNAGGVENENEANDNQEDDEEKKKKEAKVKRVRNPQPKLDVERLRGPRGLCMLEKVFENVKFKGKGHEEADLTVLMKNYEYWCHRLFPKFPFDDCLEKIEKLGHKKYLQTYVKKIRMNLVDDEPVHPEQELVDEEAGENDDAENLHHDEDDVFERLLPAHTQTTQSNVSDSNTLTDEQLRHIQINREKAQRLRQQMLLKKQKAVESLNVFPVNHTMEVDEHNTIQSQDSDDNNADGDTANDSFQLLTVQADVHPSYVGISSSQNKIDDSIISSQNPDIFNTLVENEKLPKRTNKVQIEVDAQQNEITSEITEQVSNMIDTDEIFSENANFNNQCDTVSHNTSENLNFDKGLYVENSLMQTETGADNSVQNVTSEAVEETRQVVDNNRDIITDKTLIVSDATKNQDCENISRDNSKKETAKQTNDEELNEDELADFMSEDVDDLLIQKGLTKGNLLNEPTVNQNGQEDFDRNKGTLAMDVETCFN